MEQKEITKAIGENQINDYILSPKQHSQIYEKTLPFLAKLLDKSEVQYFADEYVRNDQVAQIAQNKFKKYASFTRLSNFLTATFSSLLIISGALSAIPFFQTNLTWFPFALMMLSTIATVLFSSISASLIMIIKNGKLLGKWMENRAGAEQYRLKYFNRIAEDKELKNPEEYLEVLEYFRRYQLDMQIDFYNVRSIDLEKKSDRTLTTIAILAAIVLIINGITGLMGLQWASLASVALIVQAYSFMVNNKELSEQNASNSERYTKMRATLSLLRSQIDGVRTGLANGKKTVLAAYIKAVHEPLSTEYKQWMETMGSTAAIEELENQLKEFKDADKRQEPEKKSEDKKPEDKKIIKEPEIPTDKKNNTEPEIVMDKKTRKVPENKAGKKLKKEPESEVG